MEDSLSWKRQDSFHSENVACSISEMQWPAGDLVYGVQLSKEAHADHRHWRQACVDGCCVSPRIAGPKKPRKKESQTVVNGKVALTQVSQFNVWHFCYLINP